MSKGLPITITHLDSRLAAVIGGGSVAERKVRTLLEAEARVRVISPELTEFLGERVQAGDVEWIQRGYCPGDLQDAFLVIAATRDAGVNRQVAEEARERGLLVNVVDDPDYCDFFAPAVVRRGDLTIAVSTGGDAPALAAHLKAQLEELYDDEWATYLEWLTRIRGQIADRLPDPVARRQAWTRVLASDLKSYIHSHGDDEIQAYVLRLVDS